MGIAVLGISLKLYPSQIWSVIQAPTYPDCFSHCSISFVKKEIIHIASTYQSIIIKSHCYANVSAMDNLWRTEGVSETIYSGFLN